MNNDNSTTEPLYKRLNLERTQGEWMVADNHLEGHYTKSVLSYGSKLVADFMRHNFTEVGKNKFKNKNTLHPDSKSKANAEYTALAVNNLASIGDALQEAMNIIDRLCEEYQDLAERHASYTQGEHKRLSAALKAIS